MPFELKPFVVLEKISDISGDHIASTQNMRLKISSRLKQKKDSLSKEKNILKELLQHLGKFSSFL
jgi:hypothetical protein